MHGKCHCQGLVCWWPDNRLSRQVSRIGFRSEFRVSDIECSTRRRLLRHSRCCGGWCVYGCAVFSTSYVIGERFPPKACLEPCVGGAEQLPKSGCMFHPVLGTALFAAMRARACAHTRHRGIGRLRGPSPHLRKDATRGHECGRRLQYQVSFNLVS